MSEQAGTEGGAGASAVFRGVYALEVTAEEFDAIVAGLRLLGCALLPGSAEAYGHVSPNDGDIGDILTNSGEHAGLTSEQVDALCDRLLGSEG